QYRRGFIEIAEHEADVDPGVPRFPLGKLEVVPGDVEPGHASAPARESHGIVSWTAAEIEHRLAVEPPEPLSEVVDQLFAQALGPLDRGILASMLDRHRVPVPLGPIEA